MAKKEKWAAAKRWRLNNPKEAIAVCKRWRQRNPGWFRGRNYVRALTAALVRGNDRAKVFTDAGMTRVEWVNHDGEHSGRELIRLLSNGNKLAPVKSWREFDLSLPADVRRFLDPRNFRLVAR